MLRPNKISINSLLPAGALLRDIHPLTAAPPTPHAAHFAVQHDAMPAVRLLYHHSLNKHPPSICWREHSYGLPPTLSPKLPRQHRDVYAPTRPAPIHNKIALFPFAVHLRLTLAMPVPPQSHASILFHADKFQAMLYAPAHCIG